uniref:F-box domain-containing protein n=2 Tax=Aegilops tauschii subsp. strangulata TaxID=200361 RepID=A0A452ZBS5_AEGTS
MPPRLVRELGEMEELVEETLTRLPPDEPGNLLRASLVCKPWRGLLASHGFRRRYGDFHGFLPVGDSSAGRRGRACQQQSYPHGGGRWQAGDRTPVPLRLVEGGGSRWSSVVDATDRHRPQD